MSGLLTIAPEPIEVGEYAQLQDIITDVAQRAHSCGVYAVEAHFSPEITQEIIGFTETIMSATLKPEKPDEPLALFEHLVVEDRPDNQDVFDLAASCYPALNHSMRSGLSASFPALRKRGESKLEQRLAVNKTPPGQNSFRHIDPNHDAAVVLLPNPFIVRLFRATGMLWLTANQKSEERYSAPAAIVGIRGPGRSILGRHAVWHLFQNPSTTADRHSIALGAEHRRSI